MLIELKTSKPLTYPLNESEIPVRLIAGRYNEGAAIALMLVSDDGIGEPVASCTCNIPGTQLLPGEVIIKDWSENEGMQDWMLVSGIAYATGKTVHSGFVSAPILRLRASLLTQIHKALN